MVYLVQIFKNKDWKTESKYDKYKDAKKRCLEIVGEDCDVDPYEERKYIIPEKPFEWNGTEYENKETGEKKQGKDKLFFSLQEGYFGRKGEKYWTCRIFVR